MSYRRDCRAALGTRNVNSKGLWPHHCGYHKPMSDQPTATEPTVRYHRLARPLERLRRHFRSWSRAGANLLFPPHCAYCHAELTGPVWPPLFCHDCLTRLLPVMGTLCRRCGVPLPNTSPHADCYSCRERGPRFDTVIPLGIYRGELQQAVLRMKQPREEALSASMGYLLADRLTA